MIKYLQILLLLVLAIINTACFEVIEEVDLYENGSGKFKFTVNFSQSMPTINTLMSMEEVEGHKVPTQNKIDEKLYDLTEKTKVVKGISKVTSSSNFDDYIFVYSCEFEKLNALNDLIDTLKSQFDKPENIGHKYYSCQHKTFERKGDDLLKKAYQKMKESERVIFNNAMYTGVTRFYTQIDSVNNQKVRISASGKASMHKIPMLQLIYNPSLIDKSIILK